MISYTWIPECYCVANFSGLQLIEIQGINLLFFPLQLCLYLKSATGRRLPFWPKCSQMSLVVLPWPKFYSFVYVGGQKCPLGGQTMQMLQHCLLQMPPKLMWGSPMTKICIFEGSKMPILGSKMSNLMHVRSKLIHSMSNQGKVNHFCSSKFTFVRNPTDLKSCGEYALVKACSYLV